MTRCEELKKRCCLSREIAGCTFLINQNAIRRFFAFAHTLTGDIISQLHLLSAYVLEQSRSHNRISVRRHRLRATCVRDTRVVMTRIYTYMYVFMPLCDNMFHSRLLLPSASELLHLVFSSAASNSNVSHLDIEILILIELSFPSLLRLCTRFVAQTILYRGKARSPRISPQASLSAFVNPCCCQFLASRRYRETLCSLSPIALFINNSSCRTCSFLSFSLHLSLSSHSFSSLFLSVSFLHFLFILFILFVLLEEKTHLSRVYLARTNEKVSGRTH